MSIKDMFKGSVATVGVAALVLVGGGAWAVCQPDQTSEGATQQVVQSEPLEWDDCINKNFEAKVSYWKDILEGTKEGYVGTKLSEREAQIAADMENAAQNLRDGSYRVCWGE
jgi:hypothetical protein